MYGHDYTAALMAPTWTLSTLSALFVSARLFCRFHTQTKLWWDDFWAVFSLAMSFAMSITWSVYAAYGGTVDVPPSPEAQKHITFISWLSQTWCITGITTTKLAVAALIIRIQGPSRWRTRVLWALCSIATAWPITQIAFVWGQCHPTAKLWDPAGYPNGRCWDPTVVVYNGIACSSFWVFTDLCLVAIPVHMVWTLQMPLRRKIGICCLLSTGVFAAAMTIVRTTKMKADLRKNTDIVHEFVLFFVWNVLEVNILTMSCCVPTVVPLWNMAKASEFSRQWSHFSRSLQSKKNRTGYDSSLNTTRRSKSNKQENSESTSNEVSLDGETGHSKAFLRDSVQSTFKASVSTPGSDIQTGPGIMVTREVDVRDSIRLSP